MVLIVVVNRYFPGAFTRKRMIVVVDNMAVAVNTCVIEVSFSTNKFGLLTHISFVHVKKCKVSKNL